MAPRYDREENESKRFSREERVLKIKINPVLGIEKQLEPFSENTGCK
jgi:hypothetical protein